jgi:hypothetical protein
LTICFGLKHNLRPSGFSETWNSSRVSLIAARTISKGRYSCSGDSNLRGGRLILFLVAVSVVPFVCLALPEDWRLAVFATGILSEFLAGAFLFFEHARWQTRRRDYCHWLRLVHRRVNDL